MTLLPYVYKVIGVLLLALSLSFSTLAGSHQGQVNLTFSQQQLFDFSKRVEKTAAQYGARVFIIGRIGRAQKDLPKGITYTHTALAVYSLITTTDGKSVPGYQVYNLYQKNQDLDQSELVVDHPVEFFAGVEQLKAGIAIPSMALQKRLLAILSSGKYRELHNPNYSVVANPFDQQKQNCTEFTLDIINAAIYQTRNIPQLKANAKAYFQPQVIDQSRIKMVLAAMFMDGLSLDDQGKRVKTATFTTIVDYLTQNGLLQRTLTVI